MAALYTFRGRWVGGNATRIPGGLQAQVGLPGQFAAPETNIGLAAKEDSGWRIEDGKNRLGAGCCARTRNLARSARVFDSAHRPQAGGERRGKRPDKATPSHLKATPKPYSRHILGIDSGVQSHPKATPRPHQSLLIGTALRPQSHPKATLKPLSLPTSFLFKFEGF